MRREEEVATYLRADDTLRDLAVGGIYYDAMIPEPDGMTSAKSMPKVWQGGQFRTTIVVKQAAAVPTGDLQSIRSQRTSMSQRIEVWVYAKSADVIETVLDHVYRLMMGKRLSKAFSATQAGGAPLVPAPELPAGIKTRHEDYRIVFIRTPVEL